MAGRFPISTLYAMTSLVSPLPGTSREPDMNTICVGGPDFTGLVAGAIKKGSLRLRSERFGALIIFTEIAEIPLDLVFELLADFS